MNISRNTVFRYVALIGLILLSGWIGYSWLIRAPKARLTLPRLVNEFAHFEAPLDARSVETYEYYKGGHALVGKKYASTKTWKETQEHYDAECMRFGWSPSKTETLRNWGKDYGSVTKIYKKDDLSACLTFQGSPGSTWNYSIEISWGLLH